MSLQYWGLLDRVRGIIYERETGDGRQVLRCAYLGRDFVRMRRCSDVRLVVLGWGGRELQLATAMFPRFCCSERNWFLLTERSGGSSEVVL